MDIAPKPFLVAQGGHPGTAVFRRTGEIVAEEEAAMAPGGVAHLPHPHVVMPDRDAVATLEGQAKQAVRGVERGLDDALELQIRLDRRLLDVAARLAQLFGVVAPVPPREREIFFLPLHQRLQGGAIPPFPAGGPGPDALKEGP